MVTENVTQTVPVSHEEVRVQREPISDANRDAALDGPDISEEEHEVSLRAERPVVEKEAVPVERVRLGTETVTEQHPRRGRCRAALAIAGLDQLHIAQNVVNAILYAVLAGIAVVAVGGGIRTMSQRWEDAAARYEAEKPRIAAAARSAPSLTDQGRQAMPDDVGSGRTERVRARR